MKEKENEQGDASDDTGMVAGRRKLWQLDAAFHCSIIGTCLSARELRRLCRKMRIDVRARVSDYEMHRVFVEIVGKETRAARCVQKYLDQKYRTILREFARVKSVTDYEARWAEAVGSGDVAGVYWALVTHAGVSGELVDRAYGDVHMLSHLAGSSLRLQRKQRDHLQQATRVLGREMTRAHARFRKRAREKDRTIRHLIARLRKAEDKARDLESARQKLAALEQDPLVRQLREKVDSVVTELAAERRRAERAEASVAQWKRMAVENGDRHLRLEAQLAELHAECNALEASLSKLLAAECNNCASQETCEDNMNLCGRCILYVGGRSRQCAYFRHLVERQNGRFIHHDGGLHGGRLRLGSLLSQVDVVLCPLDCVSHDAANRVKQYCKRHGKRLVLLPRSSLAAFARGLRELVA